MKRKEKIIILSVVLLVLIAILALITRCFVFNAILHIYMRLLCVPVIIKVIQKCFKNDLKDSMRKVLDICGVTVFTDIVIVDALRYFLSGGTSVVLFFPACVPIMLMVILSYIHKELNEEKYNRKIIFIIGIPLLIISLFFEVLSFT